MMTEKEIHDICKIHNITNYTINPDGSIDVDGGVYLDRRNLDRIPIKFNKVSGSFFCSNNNITSLENVPNECFRLFCNENMLTSLEGCPKVSSFIAVHYNPLETLEGYNGDYNKLYCDNKEKLIRKHKLKIINTL